MIGKAFARALSLCVAMALSSCGGGADPAASQPQQAGPQALAAAVQVPPALDATGLMNWAEGVFSGSYFPVHLQNSILGPFVYRGPYPTGNYMGLAGDVIYIMGPSFGASVPVAVGTLGQFTCRALPQNCTSTGSRVTGTVIGKGSPLAGATVTLQDIAGTMRSATTDTSGAYSVDASNLAPPFVVTASSASGTATHMVSVGRLGGGLQNARINITPLTTLLSAMLSPTGSASDLIATRDGSVINGSLIVVTSYTVTLLAPSLTDAGFNPIGFDPISAPLDPGDAMTGLLADLTIGTTPTGANFIAPSNASPCAAGTINTGQCVTYTDPGTQTTTNPNVCGFDIATGASIPCDSSLPPTSAPPPIGIDPGQAYNFGCSGCVFFGPKDNYAAPPAQAPLPSVITVITATWFAHFSLTACSEGQCFSAGASTLLTGTPFENKTACDQAAALLAGSLSIPGVSYSFFCTQSP
jgi:hypothetical protein